MSNNLPMRPWFPDKYIAKTHSLTLEEHGALRLLCDYMWVNDGWLNNSDKEIAHILRINKPKWLRIKKKIKPFFTYIEDRFTEKDLINDYQVAMERSRKNSENGKKGAEKRSSLGNGQAISSAYGLGSAKHVGSVLGGVIGKV